MLRRSILTAPTSARVFRPVALSCSVIMSSAPLLQSTLARKSGIAGGAGVGAGGQKPVIVPGSAAANAAVRGTTVGGVASDDDEWEVLDDDVDYWGHLFDEMIEGSIDSSEFVNPDDIKSFLDDEILEKKSSKSAGPKK